MMPRISLGTCCGSEPALGLGPWLDAGGVGIDTAYDYGDQPAIRSVLAAYHTNRSRSSYFITTKLPPPSGAGAEHGAAAQWAVTKHQANLQQLGVAHVDLLLLHHPCATAACNADLWQGMERLLALNLTRAIGVSNFSPVQLSVSQLCAAVWLTHSQHQILSISRVIDPVGCAGAAADGHSEACGEPVLHVGEEAR